MRPAQAFFSKELGEFILPYDAVRTAADPRAALMDFLQSTYEAAADLGKWDRAALECAIGEPRVVRQILASCRVGHKALILRAVAAPSG